MMTQGIEPAIDRIFAEKDDPSLYNGFPYSYMTGRMAIRMLIDNEPYVRRTQYIWALDLHDKAIRALMLILNDHRYAEEPWDPRTAAGVQRVLQEEIARLTATRNFLAVKKAEGDAFMEGLKARTRARMAEESESPKPMPISWALHGMKKRLEEPEK